MSLYQLERDGDVQGLIEVLRHADNERTRARSAEFLGNFGDHDAREDVVDALVEAAQSDDGRVAANAIDSLDDVGGDALERLIADMAGIDRQDDDANWLRERAFARALSADVPELRMAAANALGRLEAADATDDLVARFDDDDPRVRARAARACGHIADPRAVDGLRTLVSDPVPGVRREAAEALGNVGSREALQALLPLYDDADDPVRRIAVDAMGNFDNDRPVEHLVAALTDESPTVQQTAVYSLVELLSNVPTDRSHDLREAVLAELSDVDDASVVAPLVEILRESPQPAQQRNTAWLLGRLDPGKHRHQVVEALADALVDEGQLVRQFAATSLAELGGEAAEERLIEVARDERTDPEARARAVFALGEIGGETTHRALDSLIEETNNETLRKRAISARSKVAGGPGAGESDTGGPGADGSDTGGPGTGESDTGG